MEEKIKWNLLIYRSVAEAFEAMIGSDFGGEKGTCNTAASLMFFCASPAERQRWVDAVKLAEVRTSQGTMLEAARKVMAATPAVARKIDGPTVSHAYPGVRDRRAAKHPPDPASGKP